MALTQISTAGVKDDAVTAGKIPANAVGSSELADNAVDTAAIADDAVTNAKVADDAIGVAQLSASGTASSSTFLRGDNSWTTVNTDLVGDTSPQLGGDLASNGNAIHIADNDRIYVGTGYDMEIYHDSGSNTNYIRGGSQNIDIRAVDGEQSIVAKAHNAVELYYDGAKKLETTNTGLNVTGKATFPDGNTNGIVIGNSSDLKLFHNGSHSYVENVTGNLNLTATAGVVLKTNDTEDSIVCTANGSVDLYHDNSKKFETTSAGIKVNNRVEITSGMIYDNTANGNNCGISFNGDGIRPTNGSGTELDNARGLGTSSKRWSELHAVTLYGDGSNLTGLGGRFLSSQQFTSSGTWTKPSGCNMIRVYVTGGGGGGGGSGAGGNDFGGAGGAGGTAIEILDVSSLSTVTVTVGSGGAKGSSASSNGSTGGTSSFGSYCSATGGTGGIQGNFGVNKGGNGGTGSGGNLNITGGDGGSGQDNSGISNQYASAWGVGGSSYWGGGGGPSSHSGAPENGKAYGSGGGAAHNDNFTAGGDGAAGIVYVEQYS